MSTTDDDDDDATSFETVRIQLVIARLLTLAEATCTNTRTHARTLATTRLFDLDKFIIILPRKCVLLLLLRLLS